MAAPIFADFLIVGLVEVFSPYPHTFAGIHEVILERLAELVPRVRNEKADNREIERQQVEDVSAELASAEAKRTSASPIIERVRPEQTTPEPTRPEQARLEPARPKSAMAQRITTELNSIEEQISRREQASKQGLNGLAEFGQTSARRFPFSHLALLLLALAVVTMALGYLLAPTIERHWLRSAQTAQSSSGPQVAVDRRGHALSPTELRKLADQGDADAQWQLGILYHDGDAVPKDDGLAVQWFQRAAEQGYVRAQSTLGAYYWAGRGVPQDFSKAYFWSQLALAQGDENSKSRLEGLSAQMTPSQVASARQQAEAWLRAHNQTANAKPN